MQIERVIFVMNKTYVKYIVLLVICCSLAFTMGFAANKAYHKYQNHNFYLVSSEENFVKSSSTRDLIRICDEYIRTNDLRYMDYIDELLNAEDYEQEVLEYYKNDAEFLNYAFLYGSKNTHLVSAIYICAVNNDIDKFISVMEKYYPQMSAGIREICFNNTMMKLKNGFIKENIGVIADEMYSLSFEADNPMMKILALSNVLAAYKAYDANNPKIKEIEKEIKAVYDERQLTDKNGIKEIQKEQMENYIYCWADMMKDHNSDSGPTTYSYADREHKGTVPLC